MVKILVVEDNTWNHDMLSRRLQRRGFDVRLALDGRSAVEVAASWQPDVILMDLSLPVMDGWQATRLIKSGAGTSHIPVVALTAHAMSGDWERAKEAGCDAYATKPVNFERLLGTLRRFLPQLESWDGGSQAPDVAAGQH